jgi:hypothetical protein
VDEIVSIEALGFSEEERKLAKYAAFLTDLRPFWPRVSTLFIGWMREQFESEGRFFGDSWAPLSADYLAWKQRVYPGKPILIATGALRKAASFPTREATGSTLILRINDPKAPWHQEGTSRMPARPILFDNLLPAVASAELDAAANEYAVEMARRLGL